MLFSFPATTWAKKNQKTTDKMQRHDQDYTFICSTYSQDIVKFKCEYSFWSHVFHMIEILILDKKIRLIKCPSK